MAGYGPYNEQQLNAQYSLRNQRPAYESDMIPKWQALSATYRQASDARIDLRYGDGERDRADFFPAKHPNGSLLVYIHGGYWQRGDKSMYSFLAEPYNHAGYAVVAINYMLCPNVKLAEIPVQCRRALKWAWQNANDFNASADKFFLLGHSAGAHLTAWMMATDWSSYDSTLPKDMIKAAAPISGLYDFEPIRHTSENRGVGTNAGFGLNIESAEEAAAVSLIGQPPATDAPQLMAWGTHESDEFRRQNEEQLARLCETQSNIESLQIADQDHFDMVDVIGDKNSELTSRILRLFENV